MRLVDSSITFFEQVCIKLQGGWGGIFQYYNLLQTFSLLFYANSVAPEQTPRSVPTLFANVPFMRC